MRRVFTIGLFSIFSIMMAGTVMAQERQVLQEGYSGIGTGRIGSGPGGGLDNVWMRNLLAKPETVYGRVWGVDIPGKRIYLETGGGGAKLYCKWQYHYRYCDGGVDRQVKRGVL